MKNWSLGKKIGVVLGILVVGSIVISVFAEQKFEVAQGALDRIVDRNVPKIIMASRINRNLLELKSIEKEHILSSEPAKFKALEDEMDQLVKEIEETYAKFDEIKNPVEAEGLKNVYAAFQAWKAPHARVRELSRVGRNKEAEAIVEAETIVILEKASEAADKLRVGAIESMNVIGAETKADLNQSVHWIIGLCAGFALLGVGLATIILRAVGAVNRAVDKIVADLRDSSTQVSAAAHQVSSASEELSQASTEQAASLEETAASIEEMNSMVKKNSENSRAAADTSNSGKQSAERGQQAVGRMIESMGEIDKANERIGQQIETSNQQIAEIVKVIGEIGNKTKVINDIVFQTKLLSFNASVEAARAGEHGKGFAVVAEEVGNLAQMSGNAAKEISAMLDSSIQKVENIVNETKSSVERLMAEGKDKVRSGAQVARECGEVLNEIVENIGQVARMASEISQASAEQASGITEITRAMSQLDQVTQQNAATSEEAASAAEQLTAQAASVNQTIETLVRTMKGGDADAKASAQPAPVSKLEKVARTPVAKAPGKLLHIKPKKGGEDAGASETKKVANGGEVPSFDDSRFKDV